MKIQYVGGRTWLAVVLNRKSYYFSKENGRVLDISDQVVINHIFSLPNRAEFQVVVEEQKEEQRKSIPEALSVVKSEEVKKKLGRPKKEK